MEQTSSQKGLMRAALLYAPHDLRLIDTPIPDIGPGDVLVRVRACGVCPTDVRKYGAGDAGELQLPMNLGHEWVGEVVQVGPESTGFKLAMRVIGDSYDGYAEYAAIREREIGLVHRPSPVIIPSDVSDAEATFVEPLADCLHAVLNRARVQPGETVTVVGAGQMGLQLIMAARWAGARVIAVELNPDRLAIAGEVGAHGLIDSNHVLWYEAVQEATGGQGADVTILSVGVPELLNEALQSVKPKGRVVLFGGFLRPARAEIDPNLIHYRELTVVGSEWIGTPPHHHPELYHKAVELIAEGVIPVKRLITHTFPLEQIHEALETAAQPNSLKVVVTIP